MKKLIVALFISVSITSNAQYQYKEMLRGDYFTTLCPKHSYAWGGFLLPEFNNAQKEGQWIVNGQINSNNHLYDSFILSNTEMTIVCNYNGFSDTIILIVDSMPAFSVKNQSICAGKSAVFKNSEQNYQNHTYEWRDSNYEIIGYKDSITLSQFDNYTVTLLSANGQCTYDHFFTLSENTIGCSISFEELSILNFPAYPNPAENQIFVSEKVQGIYTVSGSLAQEPIDNSLTIQLKLPAGLYFILYQSGKLEKLVIK